MRVEIEFSICVVIDEFSSFFYLVFSSIIFPHFNQSIHIIIIFALLHFQQLFHSIMFRHIFSSHLLYCIRQRINLISMPHLSRCVNRNRSPYPAAPNKKTNTHTQIQHIVNHVFSSSVFSSAALPGAAALSDCHSATLPTEQIGCTEQMGLDTEKLPTKWDWIPKKKKIEKKS